MKAKNCECGRPAVCVARTGKKRSRKARAGSPVALKGHPMCPQCFERLNDSLRRVR